MHWALLEPLGLSIGSTGVEGLSKNQVVFLLEVISHVHFEQDLIIHRVRYSAFEALECEIEISHFGFLPLFLSDHSDHVLSRR
jgi:hypothetical protein